MSTTIAIMGESGHGKTTSMRTLDPETTFYVDADGKGLSWPGWKNQYSVEKGNYFRTSDACDIKTLLGKVNGGKKYKTLVIDTANAIMMDDEMSRMKEKGYDKWVDLAVTIYDLVNSSNKQRDDLYVIWLFHVEIYAEDDGTKIARFLTNGKKLNKIKLETKFPTVLYSRCVDGKYFFETQCNNSTAKSPMGLFDSMKIPNDMQAVIVELDAYQNGDPKSQLESTPKPKEKEIKNPEVKEKLATGKGGTEDPGAFNPELYNLMTLSGITAAELKAYYVRKGHFPAAMEPDNLPEDYVTKITKSSIWEKVTANIKENR